MQQMVRILSGAYSASAVGSGAGARARLLRWASVLRAQDMSIMYTKCEHSLDASSTGKPDTRNGGVVRAMCTKGQDMPAP
jgi:hypothetical protein